MRELIENLLYILEYIILQVSKKSTVILAGVENQPRSITSGSIFSNKMCFSTFNHTVKISLKLFRSWVMQLSTDCFTILTLFVSRPIFES